MCVFVYVCEMVLGRKRVVSVGFRSQLALFCLLHTGKGGAMSAFRHKCVEVLMFAFMGVLLILIIMQIF